MEENAETALPGLVEEGRMPVHAVPAPPALLGPASFPPRLQVPQLWATS